MDAMALPLRISFLMEFGSGEGLSVFKLALCKLVQRRVLRRGSLGGRKTPV